MDVIEFIFLFFVLALARYWMSSSKHGSEIARQLIPRDWTLSLFLAWCVSLDGPWYFILAFVALVFIGIARLAHVVKRSDGSQVVLRWRINWQWSSFIIFFLFLTGFFAAISVIARQPTRAEDLLLLCLLLVLMIALSFIKKETYLTESGIETGSDYIQWNQIESYRWSDSENKITHLFFKTSGRFPIFNLVQLNLPLDKKAAVNEIVLRKVRHVPSDLEKPALTS